MNNSNISTPNTMLMSTLEQAPTSEQSPEQAPINSPILSNLSIKNLEYLIHLKQMTISM